MKTLKRILDRVAAFAKQLEETLDPEATVLPGFERSLQLDRFTCGAQSTYMILAFYGKARSIDAVIKALGTTEEGTDEDQIRTLLTERGLLVRRIPRPTIATLQRAIDAGRPVLVCVDGDHWSVVYGYGPSSVYLADPSLQRAIRCRHTTEKFLRRWDKLALVVAKKAAPKRRKPERAGRTL